MKTTLLFSGLFLSALSFAQTFTDGYFTFDVIAPEEARLLDYDVAMGGLDVVIPATVTNGGTTYDVTYIGYQAFYEDGITSVSIPEGVTTIVNGAFIFNDLTSVVIPNSVTHIYEAAFGANSLTSVEFGDNVEVIAANAFNGNNLTSIEIPPLVTEITKQCFANNYITELTIPNGITSIGEGAFLGNPLVNVTSVNMVPPTIATGAGIFDSFAEDRSEIYLFVPEGTTAAYATDIDAEWTGFKSVTETGFASISQTTDQTDLTLYPNPAQNRLFITTTASIEMITIVDLHGAVVSTIPGSQTQLDVSHLNTGVYVVHILTNQGIIERKMVKL
jgi:hypothetical protein